MIGQEKPIERLKEREQDREKSTVTWGEKMWQRERKREGHSEREGRDHERREKRENERRVESKK